MHRLDLRVYYEDTDAGGVVYYANYLKFCERGRTEFLRAAGFAHRSLMQSRDMLFVVRHLEADYRRSARLDDLLTVSTSLKDVGNASFTMEQTIACEGEGLFGMIVRLACIGPDGKPKKLTDDLKIALERIMQSHGQDR